MDIICDTNIWYEIGQGETDPVFLKSEGRRLLATPLSLIELVSKLDATNFHVRRDAAKAVMEHADEILPDPEHHLAAIWQVTPPYEAFDWSCGIQALASANDISDLESGIVDFDKQIRVKVNLAYATNWRVGRYDEFVDEMLKIVDRFWPGYENARRNGKAIHMPREFGERFDKATGYPEQIQQYALATYARAICQVDESEPPMPSEDVLDAAVDKLTPYARVYQKYVVRIATINAPKPNDLGDLECFLYVQEGRRVFTHDKNWLQIAHDADGGEYIFIPAAS